jgi:hypothetical protein
MQRPITVPSSTFKAANSVVVSMGAEFSLNVGFENSLAGRWSRLADQLGW